MAIVRIQHTTTYRYASPVAFGAHRLMIRPRDSHQMRLRRATVTTKPAARINWTYDVFGNVVGTARFDERADTLEIISELELEHYPATSDLIFETGSDLAFPVQYTGDEAIDAQPYRIVDPAIPGSDFALWIDGMAAGHRDGALSLLKHLSDTIHQTFAYETRFEEMTRAALDTYATRSGACRDYAALFMAAARYWGFAARFVSGYLVDANLQGAGATHAWAEVYLPDIGWIEFDPTNGMIGSERLVRVAVAREPHQAIPIVGTYEGNPDAFQGLWVGVFVDLAEPAEAGQAQSGTMALLQG